MKNPNAEKLKLRKMEAEAAATGRFPAKPNILDRCIGYVSPGLAARRMAERNYMALTGGYVAGSKSRRSMQNWNPLGNDADADILWDLPTIRERARDLDRNNALANGAINTKETSVIGSGLRLKAAIDQAALGMSPEQASALEAQIEREFALWSESLDCDIERTQNFFDLQKLVYRQAKVNGDVLVSMPFRQRPGNPYGLKLQVIEADRICNENNQNDTRTLAGGVEKDADGAPVKYHVLTRHPGSRVGTFERKWEKLPAFDSKGNRRVLHIYRKTRPGQSRGVPDLASVIEAFKQLGTYTEAEIMAAVISAMFTVFVKSPMGDGLKPLQKDNQATDDEGPRLGNGLVVNLMEGEDVTFANPNRPNAALDPFVQAILRQIGVSLELPFELLIKHFTKSYSAARASLLEAWRYFTKERDWFATNFCQPVYESFLLEAVARGRLALPGFLNGDPLIRKAYAGAYWIGPAKGQIDELKEVEAAALRVDKGFSTIERETSEMNGGDWEDHFRQRGLEVKAMKAAGIMPEPSPPSGKANLPADNADQQDNQQN